MTAADYVPLDEPLWRSDVVTLHAPLTADTHHLLDRGRIGRMKPGAFVVNTGRGPLPALVAAAGGRPDEAAALSEHRQGPDVRPGIRGARSGHGRGSTVDLTPYHLATGELAPMGGGHDLMDAVSHHGRLRSVMAASGCDPYAREWWHYSLKDEPCPDTCFDSPVTWPTAAGMTSPLRGTRNTDRGHRGHGHKEAPS